MSRRITRLSNLNEAITKGLISVKKITSDVKFDCEGHRVVTPDNFMESIQFLNETIFSEAVDFYYHFTGKSTIRIECGAKNLNMDEVFYVDCVCEEVTADELKKILEA